MSKIRRKTAEERKEEEEDLCRSQIEHIKRIYEGQLTDQKNLHKEQIDDYIRSLEERMGQIRKYETTIFRLNRKINKLQREQEQNEQNERNKQAGVPKSEFKVKTRSKRFVSESNSAVKRENDLKATLEEKSKQRKQAVEEKKQALKEKSEERKQALEEKKQALEEKSVLRKQKSDLRKQELVLRKQFEPFEGEVYKRLLDSRLNKIEKPKKRLISRLKRALGFTKKTPPPPPESV